MKYGFVKFVVLQIERKTSFKGGKFFRMSASEEEYEVDRIINDRVDKGEKQYLIRWKNFGP